MAANKNEGILGKAQSQVRETTGALRGKSPWHSVNAEVYHNNPNCNTGGNIEPENVQRGTGNKQLCSECQRLNTAGGPVGNLTNL